MMHPFRTAVTRQIPDSNHILSSGVACITCEDLTPYYFYLNLLLFYTNEMAAAAVAMDSVRDSASGSAQDSGSRTVSRTVFTEEEVDILRKAYEEGLKGTGAVHSAQLQELSARINKPISVIKVYIDLHAYNLLFLLLL